MRIVLKPQWLIDGLGGEPLTDLAVVVEGGQIAAVAPAEQEPGKADDRVLDLPGQTLLPGLINNHVHLVLPGDNTPFVPWIDTQSDGALTLRAAFNAEQSLRAGVTTVRDCGGRGTTVLDLRDARAARLAGGARVVSCGWPLTITGGHTRHFGGEVDGIDGVQRMVRRVVGKGADYVKVMAAGGGTPGSYAQYPSFTVDELRAIVETAHGFERRVSMHCIAPASIALAVEAGADLIEHASFYGTSLSPEYNPRTGEQLAKAGIPVTPTLQVARDMVELLPEGPERSLWQRRQEMHYGIVAELFRLGVPILAGSDAGWRATSFDTFWKELAELVVCGLEPVAAVQAATGSVATALGMADQRGTIRAGLAADLIAVAGDVARNIACVRQVTTVVQDGVVVVEAPGGVSPVD
ncbi:MAG: amidohydrolase family protein [Thermomicrobiales bacterium]